MRKKATTIFCIGLLAILTLMPYKKSNPVNASIAHKFIVLDAGHGGNDGGAVNKKNGLIEKDVNLKIACFLRDYLQEAGAYVLMTRAHENDSMHITKTEDLYRRVSLAEKRQADLLLSIHLNAGPSSKWSGAQTFYNPILEENIEIAKAVQDELIRILKNTSRKPNKRTGLYILRKPQLPTVLVEVGFISHPTESLLLADEDYQRSLAAAIYYGITKYFSEKLPVN
ncbi:MAG: N-acetylmuramoyl-L-alanine amidase CwlD [Bacillota bacterium]|jgi:N-acetylmuramoyl-L-alanine amidase